MRADRVHFPQSICSRPKEAPLAIIPASVTYPH